MEVFPKDHRHQHGRIGAREIARQGDAGTDDVTEREGLGARVGGGEGCRSPPASGIVKLSGGGPSRTSAAFPAVNRRLRSGRSRSGSTLFNPNSP